MELKDIKFTKEEFSMLIKGLDALPNAGSTGELMGELIDFMVSDNIPPEVKMMKERKKVEAKRKREMETQQLKEDCTILQSKLIHLRRFMEQNDMIAEAQDIINGK
jgi:hypothetical protein